MEITEKEIKQSTISQSCLIESGVRIYNSVINDAVRCFKFAHIVQSNIGVSSIVGDLSKIDNCDLAKYNKIEKYNHLYFVKMGSYTYTGPYSVIMHADIGNFCSLSWGVTIGGAEHDYNKISTHAFLYNNYFDMNEKLNLTYNRFQKPCVIENDVWIGANATVLRGVKIASGAVIAANSLVNKDVPPYAIVGGVPARVLKFRFEKEIIEELLQLKWWLWDHQKIKDNIHFFNDTVSKELLEKIKNIKE